MSSIPSTPAPLPTDSHANSRAPKPADQKQTGTKTRVNVVAHSGFERSAPHKRMPSVGTMFAGVALPGVGGVVVGATGRGRSPVSANLHVLDTGGRWEQATPFKKSQAAATANGYTFSRTMNSSKSNIAGTLAQAGQGDITVSYGHNWVGPNGKVLGIMTSAGMFGWGTEKMGRKEIEAAIGDSDPAGVVFLGACKTTPLLDSVIAGGAKVAFGFSEEIAGGLISSAADTVIAKLMSGAIIRDAAEAGNKILRGNLFNPDGAKIEFLLGDGVDANKNLLSQGIF